MELHLSRIPQDIYSDQDLNGDTQVSTSFIDKSYTAEKQREELSVRSNLPRQSCHIL